MRNNELLEGRDYYIEKGFYVFTAYYLEQRGYCCDSGCRHCPYKKGEKLDTNKTNDNKINKNTRNKIK